MGIPERRDRTSQGKGTAAFGVIPLALLDRPLDFLQSDHFRQRRFCAALKGFVEASPPEVVPNPEQAAELLAFLDRDWSQHRQEEFELLFPLLRRRSKAEDEIGPIIDQLVTDDVVAQRRHRRVRAILKEAADGTLLQPRDALMIRAYVEATLRQIAIENGVILAIARRRLSYRDLSEISHAMKVRRGVVYHVPDA